MIARLVATLRRHCMLVPKPHISCTMHMVEHAMKLGFLCYTSLLVDFISVCEDNRHEPL